MRALRGLVGWLLCWFGFHVPPRGTNVAMAIAWGCARCEQIIPGGLSARRNRRRKKW
jgi:hypothetical protein